MSDRLAVALAIAVAGGAWVAWRAPLPFAVMTATIGLLAMGGRHSAPVVLVAGFVLAGWLGARAWDGLTPSHVTPGQSIEGVGTLVADPEGVPGGVRVDVRIDGMRLRATAASSLGALYDAAAGERWMVVGRYSPLDDVTRARLASRHIAGRLRLSAARRLDGGGPTSVVANAFRGVLLRGTASFSSDERALFTGVVLGDDRAQDPTEVEDFRASGLSHLLAVSGQNVVFLLAVLGPALRRMRLGARYVAVVGALILFGTITRWEPSVTRAVGMAAVTVLATTLGRDVTSLRVLSLAVTGLVLVDPLLVHSIGFALSVAACVGLAVVAPRLRTRVPEPVAVTLAAQFAVLPVLLPTFGPVPLVSVVANLVAGPVAGPLMMWGLTGGFGAGVVGGPVATALHVPTRLMLGWLSAVARWSAGVDVLWLSPRAAFVAALAVVVAISLAKLVPSVTRNRATRPLIVLAVAVAALAATLHPPRTDGVRLDTGARDLLWRRNGTVVVVSDGTAQQGRLLGALRSANVRAIDVLVVAGASRSAGRSLGPVLERLRPQLIVGPANSQVAGAVGIETPVVITSGPFAIEVRPEGKRLTVRIGSTHAPGAGSPRVRHHDEGPRDGDPQPHA